MTEKYDWKVTVPEGESGTVAVQRFEINADNDIMQMRDVIRLGRPRTPLGQYTKLVRNGQLWMSDTLAEWSDHKFAWSKMRQHGGRVLVNGLGIGLIVQAALTLDNVEHIDVVEIDEDVIKLVAPHYACDRLTVHHADAYTVKWPVSTKWTVAWHDVWPTMCEDDLPDRTRLMRKYGNRVQWQGCWGQDVILRERQRDRRRGWY